MATLLLMRLKRLNQHSILINQRGCGPINWESIMTQQQAEKLGWSFNADGTTVEKGREIYMMPSKEMALKMVEKREQK